MKLKEFIKNLNEFIEENPKALDLDVVSCIDDEGNGYNRVLYPISMGIFEDKEFIPVDSYEDWEREASETNAVCIN